MARMRSIKPEFWMDRKLARLLSRDERMLYVGLWNQADEHGRCLGDPRVVQGTVFPYEDDLTVQDLDRMLDSLAKAGVIVRYSVDEDPYLWLPKLAQHQRLEPDKVGSRHPAPDDLSAVQIESESGADSPASNDTSSTLKHVACGRKHVAGMPSPDQLAAVPKVVEKRSGTEVPSFDDFWAVYPIKAGKAEARAAWVKAIRRADPAEIIAGAQRYRDNPTRDPDKTKYGQGWLNGSRWEDEYGARRPSADPTWQLPDPPDGIIEGTEEYFTWARSVTEQHRGLG